MASKVKDIMITIDGVELVVDYRFSGEYYPATISDPSEYPDLEIISVCVLDSQVDIQGLLRYTDIEDIEDKIWANGYD